MTPKRKRTLTFITIGIFFLFQGVEYAVILPTLWLYIDTRFHGKSYTLGIVMAAFSFSGLLASPLMGRWSDKTGNTKSILLVANIFQVVGSIMYFIGINVWFLVAARLVAGIGSGVGSAIFADIARVTSIEERTGVMSIFMAVRQVGLLLGPGCNLFLRQLHFHIGPYQVDKFNAPGVFMAIVWILHEILALFMYWNLPALKVEETLARAQHETPASQTSARGIARVPIPPMESSIIQPSSSFSINQNSSLRMPDQYGHIRNGDDLTASNSYIERAEAMISTHEQNTTEASPGYHQIQVGRPRGDDSHTTTSYGTMSDSKDLEHLYDNSLHSGYSDTDSDEYSENSSLINSSDHSIKHMSLNFLYKEFMREEIIVILFTSFVAFFNQVGMETLFTPLTKKLLNWGEFENSFLYCGAGAEIIGVFFLTRCLSQRFSDRWLLLIGYTILTVTFAVSTWYIPQAQPDNYMMNLITLMLLVFFDVLALPFLAVASASLYSKLTKEETQGFAQGVRRTSVGLGTILGPLWAGSMFQHLMFCFSVSLVICILAMVMLLLSFRFLDDAHYRSRKRRKSRKGRKDRSQTQVANGVIVRSWDETQNEQERLIQT